MPRNNSEVKRKQRREEAEARQEIRDKLTPQMQLQKLDELNFVATKERIKLKKIIDIQLQKKKDKKSKTKKEEK